jgi:hypothetical protein
VTKAAKELASIGYDPQLGARPRVAIQRQIEDSLSEKILTRSSAGEIIVVDVEPNPSSRQAALHVPRRRGLRAPSSVELATTMTTDDVVVEPLSTDDFVHARSAQGG